MCNRWYFEILSILTTEVLLVLRTTKYFTPLHTACTAHTRYLLVDTAQHLAEVSKLAVLLAEVGKNEQQKTTSTHCLPELGTLLSAVFEWQANVRCRPHGVQILMSFLFPPFYISLDLTELLYEWYKYWSLFNRDLYYVLKCGWGISVSAVWSLSTSITVDIRSIFGGYCFY